jgi:hypothetical protein
LCRRSKKSKPNAIPIERPAFELAVYGGRERSQARLNFRVPPIVNYGLITLTWPKQTSKIIHLLP